MLELVHPWVLVALPAPFLVWWLTPPHRQQVAALRVPFFQQLTQAANIEPQAGAAVLHRSPIQNLWMFLIWVFLVSGLARPEWVGVM